ncbi:MAG: hypothetical protein MRZ48_12360 [Anaerostipes hadrus]|nr:hypothetical protein [Anaerostipes hadrus]
MAINIPLVHISDLTEKTTISDSDYMLTGGSTASKVKWSTIVSLIKTKLGIGNIENNISEIQSDISTLNSDLKDSFVTQYAELNGNGNNYFYVDRKQGYRLSSAILHVYDTGYIRVEAISQEVNNENCYVLWTNNSYPQNKKIGCDLVWIKENFRF